jgi:hypothetical protein
MLLALHAHVFCARAQSIPDELSKLDHIEKTIIKYLIDQEYFKPSKTLMFESSSFIVETENFKRALTLFQRERNLEPSGKINFEITELVIQQEKRDLILQHLETLSYLQPQQIHTPLEIRNAILRFQQDHNQTQTGNLTSETFINVLKAVSGKL